MALKITCKFYRPLSTTITWLCLNLHPARASPSPPNSLIFRAFLEKIISRSRYFLVLVSNIFLIYTIFDMNFFYEKWMLQSVYRASKVCFGHRVQILHNYFRNAVHAECDFAQRYLCAMNAIFAQWNLLHNAIYAHCNLCTIIAHCNFLCNAIFVHYSFCRMQFLYKSKLWYLCIKIYSHVDLLLLSRKNCCGYLFPWVRMTAGPFLAVTGLSPIFSYLNWCGLPR